MNTRVIVALTILILSAFAAQHTFAQPCRKFHKEGDCRTRQDENFRLFGQSRSALLEIGLTAEHEVTFYAGMDYIVTCCTEFGFYPVHFRLIDISTNEVFYDNMHDNYFESIGFSTDEPRKVKIEITIKAEEFTPEDFNDNRACAGINILWRKTQQIGF
jgi:hypothetical protein